MIPQGGMLRSNITRICQPNYNGKWLGRDPLPSDIFDEPIDRLRARRVHETYVPLYCFDSHFNIKLTPEFKNVPKNFTEDKPFSEFCAPLQKFVQNYKTDFDWTSHLIINRSIGCEFGVGLDIDEDEDEEDEIQYFTNGPQEDEELVDDFSAFGL